MIGEDLSSDINRRVDTYNQALRQVAAAHAVQCLPVHDTLASLLPAAHDPPPTAIASVGRTSACPFCVSDRVAAQGPSRPSELAMLPDGGRQAGAGIT